MRVTGEIRREKSINDVYAITLANPTFDGCRTKMYSRVIQGKCQFCHISAQMNNYIR